MADLVLINRKERYFVVINRKGRHLRCQTWLIIVKTTNNNYVWQAS